jgi:hypothetical protein
MLHPGEEKKHNQTGNHGQNNLFPRFHNLSRSRKIFTSSTDFFVTVGASLASDKYMIKSA